MYMSSSRLWLGHQCCRTSSSNTSVTSSSYSVYGTIYGMQMDFSTKNFFNLQIHAISLSLKVIKCHNYNKFRTLMLLEFAVQSCPHDQLHENRSSALEDVVWLNVPTHTTSDDPPQAVWQKIVSEMILKVPKSKLKFIYMNATKVRYSFAHCSICAF